MTDTERSAGVEPQVFAAVERLLAAGTPYTQLGVQRISDEAGIARSTFYLYFPDKQALLLRLAETAARDLFSAADRWVAEQDTRDLGGLERTLAEVVAHRRRHAPALAALEEVAAYDATTARSWNRLVDDFARRVEGHLASEQAEGRIGAEVDVPMTARLVVWQVDRAVGAHIATEDEASDERLAAALARAVHLTLYARPA